MSIFQKIKQPDFIELINLCALPVAPELLLAAYQDHYRTHKAGEILPKETPVGSLDHRWYNSLIAGKPDYSVYDDPFYLCDIWLCWVLYSRKSLLALKAPNSLITMSVTDYLKSCERIADLGCGFGYTTAGLKELFPGATVIGTNLKTSFQYQAAVKTGERFGFNVTGDMTRVGACDVVFASEYFEHFENPVDHLREVVLAVAPKVMILANGFTGHAIGHFNSYKANGRVFPNKGTEGIGREFNRELKQFGYKKLETKIWNSRPAIWVRQ